MRITDMFDLNLQPIDIEATECAETESNGQNVTYIGLVAIENEGTAGLYVASAENGARNYQESANSTEFVPTPSANRIFQGESGLTIPTAQTTSATVDVEEGVEVLSTPQEPFVGMSFDSSTAAKDYYNKYARRAGFSIRIDTSRETKKNSVKSKYLFVCHKAGVNKKQKKDEDGPITEKKIVKQRRRDHIERTHCPARMIIRRIPSGIWEVVQFVKEHNHECIKKFSLTKFLASHRDIPPEEKEFIKFLHGCCITTTRAYQIMAELYGGVENCPYTEGDTKNLRVEYRADYRGKDMKATLEYFEELKKEDPNFYYSYTLDELDRVENLFWVDGEARKAYELYNDCISFDATYCTNMYNMPCTPFIGIDRNGLTIQLGCGFLRNEKTECYIWLFTEFLKAMSGRQPVNIITDQAASIALAIAEVFPNSTHRNCRWHIMENARKRLGLFLDSKDKLDEDFNDCVDNSFSIEEFEYKWQVMLNKHEINDDERFIHLYEMRHCWVPAYFLDKFYPFLQTTARSEGFNAVLKRYVNPQNSILNFLHQYKKIQKRIFSKQLEHEATTIIKVPYYLTGHPMEVQMKEAYTRKLFNVFQDELQLSSSYYINRIEVEAEIDVVPYGTCREKLYGTRTFRVKANKTDGLYSCECSKFQRDGVLCCHILKVFDALAVHTIPDRYILPRWSVENMVEDDSGQAEQVDAMPLEPPQMTDSGRHIVRYTAACNNFAKIVRPFMIEDEGHSIVIKHMSQMQYELNELKKRKNLVIDSEVQLPVDANTNNEKDEVTVKRRKKTTTKKSVTQDELIVTHEATDVVTGNPNDPPTTKKQGRPRKKAYKGVRLHANKKKPCDYCASTDHTTAHCPTKPAKKRTTELKKKQD